MKKNVDRMKRRHGETETRGKSPIPRFTHSPIHFQKGFTLIELMIVIIILALLATIVTPRIMNKLEQAKRATAIIQITNFKNGLKFFKLDNGFYPSTEQGLEALIEKPTVGKVAETWAEGGYLDSNKIPLDPWGNPYIYLAPGVHNKEYDIESYGADGVDGGEKENADIESWALER